MPLDFQPVQIVIRGLQEKTGAKLRKPGKLERAINVEYDKDGQLNKRRGYRRVDLSETTHGDTPEAVYTAVVTYQGSLVLLGEERIYAITSPSDLPIRRGPVLRGSYRVFDIVSSPLGLEGEGA